MDLDICPGHPRFMPEDAAAAIRFHAGQEADYIHGTTLFVDGGMISTRGQMSFPKIQSHR